MTVEAFLFCLPLVLQAFHYDAMAWVALTEPDDPNNDTL